MRVLLLSALLLLGIVIAFLILRKPTSVTTEPFPSPAPSLSVSPSTPSQSVDINEGGRIYRVAWLPVRNLSELSLLPNFTEKRTARSLVDNKECTEVVNGGFYTKDNQPTGLFMSEGKILRDSIPNALLNGFFLVDKNNRATINISAPETPLRIGLQTGPILIREGKPVTLAIRDDEFARRVDLGITQNGAVIFLAVYDPDNPWSGPKLADTPNILAKFISRLELRGVLNLDGGSASAFFRGDITLEELTHVGSFFCTH